MTTHVRYGAAIVLLMFLTACSGSAPTWPTTGTSSPPVGFTAYVPPARDFPPLSGLSRTFVFDHPLSYPVHDVTKSSRIVLYDNGAFVLQFPSLGEGGYRGEYKELNGGVLSVVWQGWSSAGAWSAGVILQGDSLTVDYDLIMEMTDFEDAAYTLLR